MLAGDAEKNAMEKTQQAKKNQSKSLNDKLQLADSLQGSIIQMLCAQYYYSEFHILRKKTTMPLLSICTTFQKDLAII